MNRIKTFWQMLRHFGPRLVWMRGGVYLANALGRTRRKFPARSWDSIRLEELCVAGAPTEVKAYADFKRRQSTAFFFPLGKVPAVSEAIRQAAQQRQPPLAERLKLIEENRCVYCFRTVSPTPIDWNFNPLDGTRYTDATRIWCDIPDVAQGRGDVRLFWDPSRAAWAIDLARGRSHGIDVDAGALYWRWVDSWMEACPPWRGPNWKCGQEATVRLIALALGFWAVANDSATSDERFVQFARLAWATGYRIEQHFDYARSQNNNHALSEACGLMLIGHLFPEFSESAQWFERGRAVFCEELSRQVYADGSYVQHSHNYHRVMLQTAVLAARIAQWHGRPFDAETLKHIADSEEFLFQMLDDHSGQVPLYGNNDGAWVLPVDECDFTDYRGAVQAAHFLVSGKRRLPAGPWDEDLLWLFGPEALAAPMETSNPQSTAFDSGGYYTLRGTESWGAIRCHTYRDRPGQYDALHFDFWFRGQNMLCDTGTFKYHPAEGTALEDYFQLVRGHNTVELDGCSPVQRVSRYLYFPWPRAELRHFEADGGGYRYFESQRYDYDRRPWNVLHRRAIVALQDDVWVIVDDLLGPGRHAATLRWHLPDMPLELNAATSSIAVQTPRGEFFLSMPSDETKPWKRMEIVRGKSEGGNFQGFEAPYYGERLPAPTLEAEVAGDLPLRLVTLLAPQMAPQWRLLAGTAHGKTYELSHGERSWQVELGPPARSSPRTVSKVSQSITSKECAARGHVAIATASGN